MEEGEIRDSPPPVQRQARAQVELFITVFSIHGMIGSLIAPSYLSQGLVFRVRSVRTVNSIGSR
jgi:hypothetical protein